MLLLKQSAGTRCLPKVRVVERVAAWQVLGEPAPTALGAILHAPRAGLVRALTEQQINLETL